MFNNVSDVTLRAIERFNERHEPLLFVDGLGGVHELRTSRVAANRIYVSRLVGQQTGRTFHTLRALRLHLETPA